MSDRAALIENAARLAHEVNRTYCEHLGDYSQPVWDDAPEWQKASARNGAEHRLDRPFSTPEESHENWYVHKLDEGWVWGPVKDVEAKEHPCMVPYRDLPAEQRAKDYLFVAANKAARLLHEGAK